MVEGVLKWVLLVLAAGFVGYFGRHLAMVLIRRLGGSADAPGDPPPAAAGDGSLFKTEKKRLKAEAKGYKKRAKARSKKEAG